MSRLWIAIRFRLRFLSPVNFNLNSAVGMNREPNTRKQRKQTGFAEHKSLHSPGEPTCCLAPVFISRVSSISRFQLRVLVQPLFLGSGRRRCGLKPKKIIEFTRQGGSGRATKRDDRDDHEKFDQGEAN